MKAPFADPFFQGQWLRAAGHAAAGGADLGECYAIAEAIREGDGESWRGAWTAFADRLSREAEASFTAGHRRSAHGHSCGPPTIIAPELFDLNLARSTASGPATASSATPSGRRSRRAKGGREVIGIPFAGAVLPGYFFRADGEGPKPTLIITGGYDGTAEELYFYSGSAALARGYNVVVYDGPGQGGAFVEDGLLFRPDWETVLDAVMAAVAQRPEIDRGRIALMGLSFGGYLAPRAAAAIPPSAPCRRSRPVRPVRGDARAPARTWPQPSLRAISRAALWTIEPLLEARMQSLTEGWAFRRGLCVHGVEGPLDYLRLAAEYTLAGRAELSAVRR